jgi:hypothetical protein
MAIHLAETAASLSSAVTIYTHGARSSPPRSVLRWVRAAVLKTRTRTSSRSIPGPSRASASSRQPVPRRGLKYSSQTAAPPSRPSSCITHSRKQRAHSLRNSALKRDRVRVPAPRLATSWPTFQCTRRVSVESLRLGTVSPSTRLWLGRLRAGVMRPLRRRRSFWRRGLDTSRLCDSTRWVE